MVKAEKMPDGTLHVAADEVHYERMTHGCVALPKEGRSLFDKVQHQSGYNINPKTIPVGSVIYYTENDKTIPCRRVVQFGIVAEHYVDCIVVGKVELADRRRVDGAPVKEFLEHCPTKWKKLPKGWTYNTVLFNVDVEPAPEQAAPDIRNPESILEAMKNGVLVPSKDNPHVTFRSEVDRRNGWRIVPEWENYVSFVTLEFHNAFETYADAQAACDEINGEYERQANLSDYDWSVEKIDEALDNCWKLSDHERQQYRDWILRRENVEDIEARAHGGTLQWKYSKNKTWKNIVL